MIYPTFPQKEIDRIKKQTLASIVQEENRPAAIAYRNIGKLLYGENHPYGKPLTGSGISETISDITRENVIAVHSRAINPTNLTFAVAGDIQLDELVEILEDKFGNWSGNTNSNLKELNKVPLPNTRRVYSVSYTHLTLPTKA